MSCQLSYRAREIFSKFLCSKATTPVNIDSQAQLADDILSAPHPDMFKEQQLQVTVPRFPAGTPRQGPLCGTVWPEAGGQPERRGAHGGGCEGRSPVSPTRLVSVGGGWGASVGP